MVFGRINHPMARNIYLIMCSGSIGDVPVVEATSEQWAQSIAQHISRLWRLKKKREYAKAQNNIAHFDKMWVYDESLLSKG